MNSAVSENARVVSLTLADQVFERLQQAIVEGDIRAGSKISEAALARNLGISRAPLREALTPPGSLPSDRAQAKYRRPGGCAVAPASA